MLSHREFVLALRNLRVGGTTPVIVHTSLSAFGQVTGGADAVVGALLEHFETVIMPTFTYKTMIVPESGPPNNAMEYGTMKDRNKMAEFFYSEMPADKLMGVVSETFRRQREAYRSGHPILSFCGVNADDIIDTQTLNTPLAPIASLADRIGWVLLLGVNHKSNTSIHMGERLAGRKTFTRWALMPDIIVECPKFPPCSDGFNAIQPLMAPFTYTTQAGDALLQAMPLPELIETTRQLVQADPLALLCTRSECPRCNAVRYEVKKLKEV